MKALQARIIEITDPDDELQALQLDNLADLRRFAGEQMEKIKARANGSHPTLKESAELRRWSEFLLRVLVVQGLGAAQRIEELERLAIEATSQRPRLAGG